MAKDLEVAILFADVVGSTQLYDKYGDTKASETVSRCLDIMKDATHQFNGTVIKTIGDEVMSTFPTVDDAMGAASQMQKRISNDKDQSAGHIPVSIRIGCHYGPVVQERNDIFVAAVHTANRMTSQAKAQQIITTAVTVEQLSEEWRGLVRQIDIATVRGRTGEVELFEVLWQPDEATKMLRTVGFGQSVSRTKRLKLSFKGQEVTVGDGRKYAT